MTTWIPIITPNENWTKAAARQHIFSQFVFSHAYEGSQRVFSLGYGIWDATTRPSASWTAK